MSELTRLNAEIHGDDDGDDNRISIAPYGRNFWGAVTHDFWFTDPFSAPTNDIGWSVGL